MRLKIILAMAVGLLGLPLCGQNTKIVVSWTASSSPGSPTTNVYRATAVTGPYTLMNSTPIPNGTNTYTDSASLVNGTWYFYVVTATTASGTSPLSQGAIPVCFNCKVNAPSGVG